MSEGVTGILVQSGFVDEMWVEPAVFSDPFGPVCLHQLKARENGGLELLVNEELATAPSFPASFRLQSLNNHASTLRL